MQTSLLHRLWVVPILVLASLVLSACAGGIPTNLPTSLEVNLAEGRGEFVGTVESIGPEAWTVSGQVLAITAQTQIHDAINVGDTVNVHVSINPDGTLVATGIELEHDDVPATSEPGQEIEFAGVVEAISPDAWTISGQIVALTAETEIHGTIAVGDQVNVHARTDPALGLIAREIELVRNDSDDGSQTDTEFTGTVEAIAPELWTVSGQSLGITPQTEIQDGIVVGDTVKVEALVNVDGTMVAKEISLAHDDNHDDRGLGSEIEIRGPVQAISAESWTVRGQMIVITAETQIDGNIAVGDVVKIHALVGSDGSLTAREIELVADARRGQDREHHEGNGSSSDNGGESGDDSGGGGEHD